MKKHCEQRFTSEQLPVVQRAFEVACDIVGDYFKVHSFDDLRYPVELLTYADQSQARRAPGAFAQVLQIEYSSDKEHRKRNVYQIALQDPAILKTVELEQGQVELEALLVYIFVHELIHLVRFHRYYRLMVEPGDVRTDEEAHVHRLTDELLGPQPISGMATVLQRFAGHRAGPRN